MAMENPSIELLLRAEEEAAKIVSQAKQERVRRLNDAELEAKKEIDRLRAEMEEKFQREVGQSDGSGDEKLRAFVAVTKKEQEKMLADFEKHKGTVQELLLHFVTTVDLSVSESTKQSLLKAYA